MFRLPKRLKEHARFVLEDDNEVMAAALHPSSDLDEENKQMNRDLIKEHEKVIAKINKKENLSKKDLNLIRDANEIHLNDIDNFQEHHNQAVELNKWLDKQAGEPTKDEAMKVLEKHLDKDKNTPPIVYRALHNLWEEATPNDIIEKAKPKLSKEDVLNVAKRTNTTLTDNEIGEILEMYPSEQEQDPAATWDLVIDYCIQVITGNRGARIINAKK